MLLLFSIRLVEIERPPAVRVFRELQWTLVITTLFVTKEFAVNRICCYKETCHEPV